MRNTIIRWTSPARALKQVKKHRKPVTDIPDGSRWAEHFGLTRTTAPSCGCRACTTARFDMGVK